MNTDYGKLDKFTPRELEILQQMVDCHGVYETIAAKLVISKTTIQTHANNLFSKLGVHSKTGAIVEGLRRNLVHL